MRYAKQMSLGNCFLVLMVFSIVFGLSKPAWAAGQPGYMIEAGLTGDRITVEIGIEQVNAWSGKLALQYNPEQLELVKGNNITSTVLGATNVDITLEGEAFDKMVSEQDGYITFAWSTKGVSTLDASTQVQPVATVAFRLKDGVTEEDFNKNTLRLRNLREGDITDWLSGASIFAKGSVIYEYNIDSMPACQVDVSYPNCTVTPINAYEVVFACQDQDGKAVAATVLVDNQQLMADVQGRATLKLTDGSYSYRVTAAGYSAVTGTLTVAGQAKTEQIILQNDQQLVDSIADNLAITYAAGDSANKVTKNLTLPKTGKDNATIAWSSSNQNVISTYGGVFPQKTKQTITLTATVKKNEATAKKQFTLTVLAKGAMSGQDQQTTGQETVTNPNQQVGIEGKFTDLDSVPWGREAIEALTEVGVINGTTNTTFAPNSPIKRGDFIALLMRMLDPAGEAGQPFEDVPADCYYYPQITLARGLGIAQGVDGNQFQPEAAISRQDMMVLTARALALLNLLAEENNTTDGLNQFADVGQVATYAWDGVTQMVAAGYITGDAQGRLTPLNKTTRAETAVFLYRIYQQL